MTGRIFTNIAAIAGIAGLALTWSAAAKAHEFGSPELIAAAKAEGKLVFYTANFAEVEQQVIKAFNKRFPEIRVEMVRAPGGQLITRIKTEAAADKLSADVINHSDRALMVELEDLFMDYAPPNAADYRTDVQVSPKLWPGVIAAMTLLFVLAIRELGSSLFLYTSNTMVMSVLLLDYYEGGNLGKTAAFSLVQTVLLGVLIGGANWLSRGAAQGSVARTG